MRNPFGMDEDCQNCPALSNTRTNVVHGYGDVTAEFCFVSEQPTPTADETGTPFADDGEDDTLLALLVRLGFHEPGELDADGAPVLDNAFVTHLTRCRHPARPPTDEEIVTCDPFLNAEIRMINPEIIVPIGARSLAEIATEYTTKPTDSFDVERDHATSIRGRGFELVPMVATEDLTDAQADDFVAALSSLLDGDYRQTKGGRRR